MQLKLLLNERVVLSEMLMAEKFTSRLFGLMFKRDMPAGAGLMIPKCNWVHTLFMRFPLDIVYLNSDMSVCHIDEHVDPWRFCLPVLKASSVLELNAGSASDLELKKGDILRCIN